MINIPRSIYLCLRYPFLYPRSIVTDKPIYYIPRYTWWDNVSTGWKKAFGKQFLNELKKQLKKDKMLYKWRITDVKEKFGTFRLYCNYGSDELYNIIHKYEALSWNTCIKCGKPATYTSIGWILPYCEACTKTALNSKYVGPFVKRETEEEKKLNN
jgi:hypothetical protein